ncbi:MAG: phosphatase PAP2 family protein [Negativicutes bacterium]|nr:phosphatase PAP2 family protein [Negativicutes bacterium]
MRKDTSFIFSWLLACLVGFAIVSMLVTGDKTMPFDNMISGWVQSYKSDALTSLSEFLAMVGQPKVVMIAAIAIAGLGIMTAAIFKTSSFKTIALQLVLFVTVNSFAYIGNPMLKNFFQRPRPMPYIRDYSFPSGHAMISFAFCISVAYLISRHTVSKVSGSMAVTVGVVITILMGLSRIYLNVHYPTDIIAGFLASGFILSFTLLLVHRFAKFVRKQ